MTLEELRIQIDEVDSKLIELYEKRIEIAENIAKAKMEINKPVFDPEREKVKLCVKRQLMPITKMVLKNCLSFL